MKKIAIACALFCAAAIQPCLGQTGWQSLNSGSTAGFKGAYFIDTKHGYVAGSGPELRVTTDGGTTWKPIAVTGATDDFWGVYASPGPNGDSISVVGDNGAAYRSNNGGATWTRQDMHYTQGFAFGLSGVDAKNMYVTGYEGSGSTTSGVIVATHDGGATWTKSTIAGAGSFDKSFFLNANTGYAVGGKTSSYKDGGVIYKTTDAGAHWTLAASTAVSMNSIYCFDENHWIAVGYNGLAVMTTDGGAHLTKLTLPAAQSLDPMTHVVFIDDNTGFITDALGTMLKTTDGGATWKADNTLIAGSTILWSIAVAKGETETVAFTVGESGSIFRLRVKKVQLQPAVQVSAPSLDFGKVLTGSKDLGLTISAANQLGIRVDSVYIASPANGFSLVSPPGPFPITLPMGSSLSVPVRFTFNGGDDAQGHLIVTTNDPANPSIDILLTAKQKESGGGSLPAAVLGSTSLAFGTVTKDSTKDITFTLAAANQAGIRVSSFSVENETIAGTFTVVAPTGPLPINVQMGNPLTIAVRFKPAEIATETADLYITTNAATGGDLHLALSGAGVAAPIASVSLGHAAASGLAMAVYPNPIASTGTVRVTVPVAGHITVALHDMLGRECTVLFDGTSEAGTRAFTIDAARLPNGVYTCIARQGESAVSEKITVMK